MGMIALVGTVLNEAKNISALASDIKKQTSKPDEVVFVDAGSSDGTVELLKKDFRVLVSKGANRSAGRNKAVQETHSDIVAVCDAGTRVQEDWLYQLTKHFSEDSSVDVVAGFFKPDAETFYLKCLASATIPILDEIEEDRFFPSSRSVAFKKTAWKEVGGYPEWLPICEDLIFDMKLKKHGFKFKFEPKAIALWKPREKLSGFFKQYFSYARGDGHAKLWTTRHLIRYSAYCTGFLFIFLAITVSPLWLLPFFAAQLGYFSKFYYRFMGHFTQEPEYKLVFALPYISFLVVVGDIAKMIGYPIGVLDRFQGRIKYEPF